MKSCGGLWILALLICLTSVASARGAAGKPGDGILTRHLMMSACYVKESEDRAWQLRFVGHMTRGPGIYVIVFNEAGDIVKHTDVPWGNHTVKEPYVIDIPADGKAQQYVIKLLGQQDNFTCITLPLTTLPYEVYTAGAYGTATAAGQRRIVAFQAPSSGEEIWFNGWKGNYRILDENGEVVADSKDKALPADDKRKKGGPREIEMPVTLSAGKTYWLDPYGVMYLRPKNLKLYLTFDPPRWFEPKLDWTLEDRPWWKGLPK